MSTAIKLYLRQITLQKRIPFVITTENGFTIAEEQEILAITNEARRQKNISKLMYPKQALKHLNLL